MRVLPILASLAMLAACGQAPDQPQQGGAETVVAAPQPQSQPAHDGLIPARFHGVWDYVEGSCARESDLRKEISATEIMFYESIGTVRAIAEEGDDVVVTLAMQGEGDAWEQKVRISLVGAGADQRLETSNGAAPKVEDEFPSKRCPQ